MDYIAHKCVYVSVYQNAYRKVKICLIGGEYMFDAVLKVLSDEIELYKSKENVDWNNDKNEGFKLGIKYCKELVEKMKKESTH